MGLPVDSQELPSDTWSSGSEHPRARREVTGSLPSAPIADESFFASKQPTLLAEARADVAAAYATSDAERAAVTMNEKADQNEL